MSRRSITNEANSVSSITVIADTITPDDTTTDLGSSSNKFRNAYLSGSLNATSLVVTGTSTLSLVNATRLKQSDTEVTIGYLAGFGSQGAGGVAIGNQAGNLNQGISSIAIGETCAVTSQGGGSVAIGGSAANTAQGLYSIAVGFSAGYTGQGYRNIAIGTNAGYSSQSSTGDSVAIGSSAGYSSQGTAALALGYQAGYTGQGTNSMAVGFQAGYNSQGPNNIAFGNKAGYDRQSSIGDSIAIGTNAGYVTQGLSSVAIGTSCGFTAQGAGCVALGSYSGLVNQNTNSVAVGAYAGAYGQGPYAVALGNSSGYTGQGLNSVAIGYIAGESNFGAYSIGIGSSVDSSGKTGVIMLNAAPLGYTASTSNAFYVNPVRQVVPSVPSASVGTPTVMMYNTLTKEISYNTGLFDSCRFYMNTSLVSGSSANLLLYGNITELVSPNGSCIGLTGRTTGSVPIAIQNTSTVTRNFLIMCSSRMLTGADRYGTLWFHINSNATLASTHYANSGVTGNIGFGSGSSDSSNGDAGISAGAVIQVPAGHYVYTGVWATAGYTVYGFSTTGLSYQNTVWSVQAL